MNASVNHGSLNATDAPADNSYLIYEHGFYTDMFFVNLVLFGTGAVSTVMNVSLLYITVKYKSLHNTYNHLLAITALCDSLHCCSFVVGFYNSVIGRNLIHLLPCYFMQIYAVIAWSMSVSLLLIIAVDRLIAILRPIWHRNVKQWWYIAVLCMPGVAFTAWIVVISYRFALDDSEHLVFCMYSACFLDYVGTLMFRSCAVLNGLTIACYVAIWLAMKQMKINSASMRRTVKSLVAIMICVIGSWTFNAVLEIVMQYATAVGQTIWLTTRLGAVAINVGCGVNVVLLYNFSSDYNTVIVKELGPILHLAGKKFTSSMASVQRVNPKFSGNIRSRTSAFSRVDVSVHVSSRIQAY